MALCTSVCVVQDDHWGNMSYQCELAAGHDGPHVMDSPACNPPAWRSWFDDGRVPWKDQYEAQ